MALAQHSPKLLPLALDANALAALPEEDEEEAPGQISEQSTTSKDSSTKTTGMCYLQLPTDFRTRSNSASSISDSAESTDYSRRNSQDFVLESSLGSDGGEILVLSSLDDDEDLVNLCGFHNTSKSLERRKKTPLFNSDRRRHMYTRTARAVKLKRPSNYS